MPVSERLVQRPDLRGVASQRAARQARELVADSWYTHVTRRPTTWRTWARSGSRSLVVSVIASEFASEEALGVLADVFSRSGEELAATEYQAHQLSQARHGQANIAQRRRYVYAP